MENPFGRPERQYYEDCGMIDICKEIGATYKLCYKGTSIFIKRCSAAEKQSILQQYQQNKQQAEMQEREEKIQILRDKKAVRRSWVQLLLAAVLGGAITKLIDFFPVITDWIKSLSK